MYTINRTPDFINPTIIHFTIQRWSDNANIPCDNLNADCNQFLVDWRDGKLVQDYQGNPVAYSLPAVAELGLEPAPDGMLKVDPPEQNQ